MAGRKSIKTKTARFRFYEELNDFLPPEKKKKTFTYSFFGKPSVKDVIESLDVPHTEVDLILVNGDSVGFGKHLRNGDSVSVYPVFEAFDISSINRLRPKPLRNPNFILDVHLGKLARYLRMFGFDTLYRNDYDDQEIVDIAGIQKRIILTRNRGLLKIKSVTHGYWLRSTIPGEQIAEVIAKFDLTGKTRPFLRCLECNMKLQKTDKKTVQDKIPPNVDELCGEFYLCKSCDKVYWKGTHYWRMERFVADVIERSEEFK
ncbi:Mut7-C RNAse domain-containing protein [Fibrobacterota bacterium]